MAEKKALQRLVRGDDGRLAIVLIDLETLQPVTDPSQYKIVSAGSASLTPEPVAEVEKPDTPSTVQSEERKPAPQVGGGGGGALEGRRPEDYAPQKAASSFPPAPPAPVTPPTVSTNAKVADTPGATNDDEIIRKDLEFPPDETAAEEINKEAAIPSSNAERQALSDPQFEEALSDDSMTQARDTLSSRLTGGAESRGATSSVHQMDPDFRNNLVKMIEAAPPEIKEGLQIHSGYRSPELQQELYSASGGSGMVAKSGYHPKGMAADLSWNGMNLGNAPKEVQDWVHSNAEKFGLSFPMNDPKAYPYEPWHIENISARKGAPWNPPEAPLPTEAPRTQVPIGGGLALGPVGGNLQDVSGLPMTSNKTSFVSADKEYERNQDPTFVEAEPFVSADKEYEKGAARSVIEDAKDVTNVVEREEARSFADASPAYFAANGLVDRTAEQISEIARTFAGELSPAQLQALKSEDPVAQMELANMMTSLENRAASKFFGGSFSAALAGSYDSLDAKNLAVTDYNYKLYGGIIEEYVSSFYKGGLKPSSWEISSYYNPALVTPTWGAIMNGVEDVGDHRFGSLTEYDPTAEWKAYRETFATYGDREGRDSFGTIDSPGFGRSSIDVSSAPSSSSPAGGSLAAGGWTDGSRDSGGGDAYSERSNRNSFGTTESSGYGRSSLGVNESGGGGAEGSFGSTSSGPSASSPAGGAQAAGGYTDGSRSSSTSSSSSSSSSKSSSPSSGGYTGSPTSDGYADSKTPGGGF